MSRLRRGWWVLPKPPLLPSGGGVIPYRPLYQSYSLSPLPPLSSPLVQSIHPSIHPSIHGIFDTSIIDGWIYLSIYISPLIITGEAVIGEASLILWDATDVLNLDSVDIFVGVSRVLPKSSIHPSIHPSIHYTIITRRRKETIGIMIGRLVAA